MTIDYIPFSPAHRDLDQTAEYWESDTYYYRKESIINYIRDKRGSAPSINMQFIRECSFMITDKVTILELVYLAEELRKLFLIDCFEISIDRVSSTAHMLFDFYNKKEQKCIYINKTQHAIFSVLIVKHLKLPVEEPDSCWLRYFMFIDFYDNKDVFDQLLEWSKHQNITSSSYSALQDCLQYCKQLCQKNVK